MLFQFSITVNGIPIQLGSELPESISSCSIVYVSPMPIGIPKDQIPSVKQWFNDLISRCTCEYIILNNTFYKVTELNKFEDIS